jgi:hypothetical protein
MDLSFYVISAKALCMNSAPIRDGIEAVSCACNSMIFDGAWDVIGVTSNVNTSESVECFGDSCSNVSSGVLASQSLVCYGTWSPLVTYQANLTLRVSSGEGCVDVNVLVVPGRVFSYFANSPLSLSFLKTNYNLMGNNSFAVVTNEKNVTVGQIQSDMIRVEYEEMTSGVDVGVSVVACLLFDSSMGEGGEYDVFDIGILEEDGVTIRPAGLKNTVNMTAYGNLRICMSEMELTEQVTSMILIKRDGDDDYESARANTKAEEGIVLGSGVLFCVGAGMVFVFHCFIPFNLAVCTVGIQSFVLLSFRGVYFIFLVYGEIGVGGLLDFALIEAPTFVYIGIFLEIILVAYWLFFRSDVVSTSVLAMEVVFAMLVNWSIFAAIILILSNSNTSPSLSRPCNCQLSEAAEENRTAELIRIIYKSVVVGISMCVTFVTVVFGKKHVESRNREVFYEVVGLSVGLLLDCVGFLIYYYLNTPTAYFLVVLWFTELLPIVLVNGTVASTYIGYWIGRVKVFFEERYLYLRYETINDSINRT